MTDAREVLKAFRYPDCSWYPHEKEGDPCRHCDSFVEGILAALAEAGLVIVPREPTPEMTHQATLGVTQENGGLEWSINAACRAMVEAANEQ